MSGILYVTGTPIGNLNDMSPRALETLEIVDFIAAEDTRVTLKLLNRFSIKKPMISYYEHNIRERGEVIISRIENGENCALVTDAGMPAISDPGEDLVRLCREKGIEVISIPGPCAMAAALSVSGMPSGRFCFEGFLSVNKKSRFAHLEELKTEQRTMIFYEAPHKFFATVSDMLSCFGDRKIAIVRELTKIHEEVINTTLANAVKKYEEEKIKGEIVLIVEGAAKPDEMKMTLGEAVSLAREHIENGSSTSEAAKLAAAKSGIKKGEIYKMLTEF